MTKVFQGANVLSETERYILTRPQNSQDMNYHLFDLKTELEHLIDIGDIQDNEEELEEYGGILFEDLKALDDMYEIEEIVWRTLKN